VAAQPSGGQQIVRTSKVNRKTKETDISLSLRLDGTGKSSISTGMPFFNHMLEALAAHGWFDLDIRAKGDLDVDLHHTVEDVGICLGEAIAKALDDKAGISRFGSAAAPLDEALVLASIDLSGRGHLSFDLDLKSKKVRGFEVEHVEEFFRGLTRAGGITLHLKQLAGRNTHHIIEAAFKATALALREAVSRAPRTTRVPSTKGKL
jgi:imidazoleglycerol-phosphate dehydratase